jgi:hypothetical protein
MADAQDIADALAHALGPLVTALTPAPPVAVAAVATKFALTPAHARSALLDYALAGDAKIYNSATAKLDTVFSLDKPNITILLSEFGDRANSAAWQQTIEVIVGATAATLTQPGNPGTTLQLINDYERLTLEQVRVTAKAHHASLNRNAQNDHQIYTCLSSSVDEVTKSKMLHEKATYMVGANRNVPSGMLYFKLLMNKADVNSRAKAAHIRDNLNSLGVYMTSTAEYNISKFNDYVNTQTTALAARGETTHDLLNNLFKGYAKVGYEEFRDVIKIARRDWETGRDNCSPEILMALALETYNRMTLFKTWGVRSPQEELITGLQAQITALTAVPPPTKKVKPPKKPELENRFKGKWAWKNVKPGDGRKQPKEFEGKTYHWCPGHGFWTLYDPKDCTTLHPDGKKEVPPPKKKLTFAEAALAEMDEENDEESSA